MLMQSKATAAAVALGGALTLFAGPAVAKSPLTTVHCGQTLTQSVKLANDLTDCPAPGLAIGADAITVDLNGHTIDGTVTQTDNCQVLPFGIPGIDTRGHNGLTIKNGTVQQFLNGIAVGPGEFEGPPTVGMANSVVRDITARDNSFVGIGILGGELTYGNRIEHNVVTGTRCDAGIELHGTHGNRIADNRSTGNGGTGIFVIGLDHSAIEDNRVSANDGGGVLSGAGSDNVIRRNVVSGGPEDAIHVFDAGDAITANQVTGGIGGIVVEGFDSAANQVSRNRVSGTADGIVVFANATVVSDNRVTDAIGGCDGCGFGSSSAPVAPTRSCATRSTGRCSTASTSWPSSPTSRRPTRSCATTSSAGRPSTESGWRPRATGPSPAPCSSATWRSAPAPTASTCAAQRRR